MHYVKYVGSVEIVRQTMKNMKKIQPFIAKNLYDFGFYLWKITGTFNNNMA